MEVIINGIYRHYKGGLYIVEDIATSSEDLSNVVIYRALYGEHRLWARPYDKFIEEIEGKDQAHRFELTNLPAPNNLK